MRNAHPSLKKQPKSVWFDSVMLAFCCVILRATQAALSSHDSLTDSLVWRRDAMFTLTGKPCLRENRYRNPCFGQVVQQTTG